MTKPVVYILHGDDEYAIRQALAKVEHSLGDPGTAQMNIDRFDKRTVSWNEISMAMRAMPFLAERRLVIVEHALEDVRSAAERENLLALLADVPETTMLVLVITKPLVSWKDRRGGKKHWLEEWAAKNGERVYLHEYSLPRGREMERWLIQKAKAMGGEITPAGAQLLSSLIGDDPRVGVQELSKLLTYVNYKRPVDEDDVENLTAYEPVSSIFSLVDAIGQRSGKEALRLLNQLLERDDPFGIFGMIVRQFRLLLLAKEAMAQGYRSDAEIAQVLGISPFVARKVIPQTHNFSLEQLKALYYQLGEIDIQVKTSQITWDVALNMLVADLAGKEG